MKGTLQDYIYVLQRWADRQPDLPVVIHTESHEGSDGIGLEMHIHIEIKEMESVQGES